MADGSTIEWLRRPGTKPATWNPVRGCSRVSPGCGGPGHAGGCYAEKIAARFSDPGQPFHGFAERTAHGGRWTGKLALIEEKLTDPLRWRTPRTIFVNSMSDLFHEGLPDEAIDQVFAVMALTPQHTHIVLTKRAERMRSYVASWFRRLATSEAEIDHPAGRRRMPDLFDWSVLPAVLPNVWLGVSAERQQEADERIPHLLATPAAVRFVSLEPLLGPITLHPLACGTNALSSSTGPNLSWCIVGGESGPHARPFDIDWARKIVAQCRAAGVKAFVKQLGSNPVCTTHDWNCTSQDTGRTVRLIAKDKKGGDITEFPADLRVREMPEARAT